MAGGNRGPLQGWRKIWDTLQFRPDTSSCHFSCHCVLYESGKREYAEILRILGIRGQNGRGLEYDLSMAETCMESLKGIIIPTSRKEKAVYSIGLGAAEIQEFTDEASRQTYMEANKTSAG